MNDDDMDRWTHQQGPPPPGIEAFLKAARKVPPMTEADGDRMDRVFVRTLLAQRKKRARAWMARGALGVALAAACVLLYVFWPTPPLDAGAPHVKLPAEPEDAGTSIPSGPSAPRPHPRRR